MTYDQTNVILQRPSQSSKLKQFLNTIKSPLKPSSDFIEFFTNFFGSERDFDNLQKSLQISPLKMTNSQIQMLINCDLTAQNDVDKLLLQYIAYLV